MEATTATLQVFRHSLGRADEARHAPGLGFPVERRSTIAVPSNGRAPHAPMLGLLVGAGISLVLWALIGWGAWALLA